MIETITINGKEYLAEKGVLKYFPTRFGCFICSAVLNRRGYRTMIVGCEGVHRLEILAHPPVQDLVLGN